MVFIRVPNHFVLIALPKQTDQHRDCGPCGCRRSCTGHGTVYSLRVDWAEHCIYLGCQINTDIEGIKLLAHV
ncbi:hypothetical protein RRG08_041428 [Elysia crispata]|uniref:Uncharacterized protein n=1 Tax=Elysia crispata TaxID=231223 RepID=A0AAE1A2N2_9GAST|nr:hypothetical protein RRG08_041428 [Elysia crispata]